MKSIVVCVVACASVAAVALACSGSSDGGTGPATSSTSPTNTGGSTSSSSSSSSGASSSSSTSSSSSSSSSSGATDSGADSSKNPDGHCGDPGDVGNSKGVGKYCTDFAGCGGNGEANLCAVLGSPTAKFCTKICKAGDGTSVCGENAACTCNSSNQCGCTPTKCL